MGIESNDIQGLKAPPTHHLEFVCWHFKLFTLSSPTLKFIEREVGEKDKFLKMVLLGHIHYLISLIKSQVQINLIK